MAKQDSIIYMYQIFFIHSSVNGHLGCLLCKQCCDENWDACILSDCVFLTIGYLWIFFPSLFLNSFENVFETLQFFCFSSLNKFDMSRALLPSVQFSGSVVSNSLRPHLSAIRWCHLHIWGYWYFSQQSWFQLVLPPAQHFSWCTLRIVTFR